MRADAKGRAAPGRPAPLTTAPPPSSAEVASTVPSAGDAARELARRGWHVFPCQPGGKRAIVKDWEHRATTDLARIARCWATGPYNIGVACGPSGLVVIDLDTHGELPEGWQLPGIVDGRDVLAQLCEWAGQPWPGTYMVATPSGGWHLYYQAPDGQEIRNSAGKLGPLVDVRGGGGLVVGVGSVVNGRPYELLDGRAPVPLPAWLCRMLAEPQEAPRHIARLPRAPAGDRLAGLAAKVREGTPGDRTGPLVWAAHRLAEMIADGQATADDGELLVQAAGEAGIRGGERYARGQVAHVLGAAR